VSDCVAIGVIPARWGSTRFPGKSLAMIAGKPLVVRVVERAMLAKRLKRVVVATDDVRIAAAVRGLAEVAMTRADHPSGTDRIAEAVAGAGADVVVNIQGDEPMMDPALVDRLVAAMQADAGWDMGTAAAAVRDAGDLANPSVVKVVWDRDHRALYFSRHPIPFVRDSGGAVGPDGLHWRHIGLYAYRRAFLERLVKTPPCRIELAEKLEQLRALYLGARMLVLETEAVGVGVDTPADVHYVESLLRCDRERQGKSIP
jgi:3-deoxy-manno-octulosonate cytidylyltransferase (CMP-KDO synthetase)